MALRVGGHHAKGVVDTGCVKHSVCGMRVARKLGLKLTDTKRRLVGLGYRRATMSEPFVLHVGNLSTLTSVCVVEDEDFPFLLGLVDLSSLRIVIDLPSRRLIQPAFNEFEEIIAAITSADGEKGPEEPSPPPDPGEDARLLEEGKEHILQLIGDQATAEQRQEVLDLFVEYSDVWLRPKEGQMQVEPARFEVAGRPFKARLRRYNDVEMKELKAQCSPLIENGTLVPSKSEWAANPLLVPKAGGVWRMVVNYIPLNKSMVTDAYPIPLLWDNLQEIAGHEWYFSLDLTWGFWSHPLDQDSQHFTAFNTPFGLYEWTVLPFGIKNSPSIFQRSVDKIFGHLYRKGLRSYIDDLIIYADDWRSGIKTLREVLQACREGGVYLQLKKCQLARRVLDVLGNQVSRDGIQASPKKVEAIRRARTPRDKSELKSFMGTMGFVAKFIPHYSALAAPLFDLLQKRVPFVWGPAQEEAFVRLKGELEDQLLLSAPRGSDPLLICCDACDYGIGAFLLQQQEEDIVLIDTASKKLSDVQTRWDTREKEMYAIKWSLEKFRDYAKGIKTYVLSDHESLQWMVDTTVGKVQRWFLFIQQFHVEIHHLAGKDNLAADWLSRSVPEDEEEERDIEAMAVPSFPVGDLRSLSSTRIAPYVPTRTDFEKEQALCSEETLKDCYKSTDGLYYHIQTNRLFVPPALREPIMFWVHASPYGGHAGVNRMYRRLKTFVWWERMQESLREYKTACLVCQRSGPCRYRTLRHVLERPMPFQLVSCDYVGERWVFGVKWFYLVLIDHCTRYCLTIPVDRDPDASHAVKSFREEWFAKFGAPGGVLADRGVFRAEDFLEFVTKELQAYPLYSSPAYPRGNGLNESVHRGLDAAIGARLQYDSSTPFPDVLMQATLAYNATPHGALGCSPYFSLFGMHMPLPGWQFMDSGIEEKQRRAQLEESRRIAMVRAVLLADRELSLDRSMDFAAGDLIVYHLSPYQKGVILNRKADERVSYSSDWSLPQEVVEVKGRALMVKGILAKEPGEEVRQVPVAACRKLLSNIPPSLHKLASVSLDKEKPSHGGNYLEGGYARLGIENTTATSAVKKRKTADVSLSEGM